MKQDVVDGAIDIDGRFTDVTLSISTTRLSGVCILLSYHPPVHEDRHKRCTNSAALPNTTTRIDPKALKGDRMKPSFELDLLLGRAGMANVSVNVARKGYHVE